MPTRRQITDVLKDRFEDVKERGKILGQALKVRTEIAATRRRLRSTYAELGEEIYNRLKAGTQPGDSSLDGFCDRVDGIKAELKDQEEDLRQIMKEGLTGSARKGWPVEESEAAPGSGANS